MQTKFEQRELSHTDKRNIEECFILGKLADDDTTLPGLGSEPGKAVSYSAFGAPGSIVFYVKAYSDEPSILKEQLEKRPEDVYITFDNRNKLYLGRENYEVAEDKIEFIRKHFQNKLILFKPKLNYESQKKRYHYNFDIVLVDNEGEPSTHYVAIPHYKNGISHKRFEKLLLDQKPIELEQYNHSFDIPEFIVCDNFIYHIPDPDVFEKYKARTTTYICRKPKEIKRIPLPHNWHFSMAKAAYKDLCFISTKNRGELIDEIDQSGEIITESYKQLEKGETTERKERTNPLEVIEKQEGHKGEHFDEVVPPEYKFLERLEVLAEERDLIYDQNDLKNLHISLKTSKFTILGGMSGTGKSELARLYADALGLIQGDNLLFIPVSPSFTEPSDVLGFLNQQTGIYMESDTGLVSFLLKANKEKNKMFMVIFDEMNLGQVEHYFSDFISILEAPIGQRKLKLFSDKAMCRQEEYRDGIEIGENVLFVGTANFDETGKEFSNRLLDRSNVLILEKKGFLEAKIYEEEQKSREEDEITSSDLPSNITFKLFTSWIKQSKGLLSLEDVELKILDELHDQISNYDSQTGVSFRIVKSISKYLINVPFDEDENELLSRDVAFDYQIKQRILPKIRGYRDQIENLVFKMDNEGKPNEKDGKLGIILTKYEGPKFEKSLLYLEQKAKELIRNGYTL
ncbi:AAA domain-containing protein [Sutcliffiella horikoshii]|uniref:AAA domain-containing protein n=1 Tax=Sutcliffiella horikoshii TaxID=79883 RepID=A0A5D4S6Q5_9BACI|nr:AAA family ATPase [Sutcliffiella horikoshii]TYS59367.1 AAA domain-containing protein [Sutcliffiella horikoshii]